MTSPASGPAATAAFPSGSATTSAPRRPRSWPAIGPRSSLPIKSRSCKPPSACSGDDAEDIAPRFRSIHITAAAAQAVFGTATLPKYEAQTSKAFPGYDLLPDVIRGALVSLVFNRGPSLIGERRREMRSIQAAISFWSEGSPEDRAAHLPHLVSTIAAQFRSMKRLWIGKGLDGLIARREAEAKLVESALAPTVPEGSKT